LELAALQRNQRVGIPIKIQKIYREAVSLGVPRQINKWRVMNRSSAVTHLDRSGRRPGGAWSNDTRQPERGSPDNVCPTLKNSAARDRTVNHWVLQIGQRIPAVRLPHEPSSMDEFR
jgi:hypothetical protein